MDTYIIFEDDKAVAETNRNRVFGGQYIFCPSHMAEDAPKWIEFINSKPSVEEKILAFCAVDFTGDVGGAESLLRSERVSYTSINNSEDIPDLTKDKYKLIPFYYKGPKYILIESED